MDDELLDVEVLTAASSNQPVAVSKWLQSLPMEDTDTRSRMVRVLKLAAHCLHVDVIKQFKSPRKINKCYVSIDFIQCVNALYA